MLSVWLRHMTDYQAHSTGRRLRLAPSLVNTVLQVTDSDGRKLSGERLKAFVSARWTRSDGGIRKLAERLGVAPDTVYSWFRGEHPPDAFDLEALAGLLGVSRWQILAAMDGEEFVVDLRSEEVRQLLRDVVDQALDDRQVPQRRPRQGDGAA